MSLQKTKKAYGCSLRAAALLFGFLLLPIGQPALAQTSTNSEKLVAIVNGISVKQYEYDLAKQSLEVELVNLAPAQQQQKILQHLVDLKLMSEAARHDGFDQRIEYKQKISYLAEQTLNNIYFANKVLQAIDDAALLNYYKQEMKKITPTIEMHARHILFDDAEEANKVLKLLNDGADFIKMATEYSVGPTKTQGGDLGFFTEGEVEPQFSQAIAMLKVGDYTKQLVKTKFGFHIIKLVGTRQKPLPTFEKVKQSLYGILVQRRVEALRNKLRKNAKIELFIEQDTKDVKNNTATPTATPASNVTN